ncbi:MAG: rhomboid family intramembrane serine protease [Flavobacteriaceae bacterium]
MKREPILNIPSITAALVAVLAGVHLIRLLLPADADYELLLTLALIPARTIGDPAAVALLPGGEGARWWSLVSYAVLHGSGMHLVINSLWIAAFGTPVARRFGNGRFIALVLVAAVAGALAHLAIYPHDPVPVIGASAAGSGLMGAAARFAFDRGGPLDMFRRMDPLAPLQPAAPLSVVLRQPRVVFFTLIWLGLNVLFGIGSSLVPGVGGAVAWQAHIGGFAAGLLLFPLFDGATARRRQVRMAEVLRAEDEWRRAQEDEPPHHNGSS